MNNADTHVDTHPSGHPNRTAVNAENPIFGRPADPIPAVSFQQAAVVQSEKHPRETVQSPLLGEADSSPVPISEEPVIETGKTLPELSAEEISAAENAEQAQDSSPSAEDLDAVAAETAAKEATAGAESEEGNEQQGAADHEQFFAGQKVRFAPDSGNDTTPIYTIETWSREPGEGALLFWKLEEMPGSLFLPETLEAVTAAA